MPSGSGNSNDYDQQRLANIERNKRRLAHLCVPGTLKDLAQQKRPKKTRKKNHNPRMAAADPPNLRPRQVRNYAEIDKEEIVRARKRDASLDVIGDFLTNNEDIDNGNVSNTTTQHRKGRGITKKDSIFSRKPDMPKIKIKLNDHGQPVGENARELSSVIGCQVRKSLSLAAVDWRLVDDEKKYAIWTDIKLVYDIHDDAYNWFMCTAGKKWKDFKGKIKKSHFRPDMDIDEVTESPDSRINIADWKFLVTYWLSEEFQARSEIAKANRAKLELLHAAGSVSYACSEYDLGVQLGRPPRRDETFIKTHTRKNGLPSRQAEPIINQLKEIVETRPELKERTIQEGDAFAAVCGQKEPKGYVRVMGLGPTPQDVGTPGLKCHAPTRLKMEILARKKAEQENTALQQRIADLEARIGSVEERAQYERASDVPQSQHDSTSHQLPEDLQQTGDVAQNCASTDDDEDEEDCHEQYVIQSRPRSEHDNLDGKEVVLYALLRSEPVAKGTIVSTRPTTVVGGQAIGREFCEVVVTSILKRDAILPRPYDDMKSMADTQMMSIAWPYKKLKAIRKASSPHTSGSIGPT